MRSQNRKVNNVGRASCAGLLALSLALVSPMSISSAFAEEVEGGMMDMEDAEGDGIPAAQAETPSTVSISFSPVSGSASLSPTTSVE